MPQEKLKQANQLIRSKKYDQAYSLLSTIKGHPTADKWLEKLAAVGYGVRETYSFLDEALGEDDIDSLFDERQPIGVSTQSSYRIQPKTNAQSYLATVDPNYSNDDEDDYSLVKSIASLYKFFGVFLIVLGLGIGGYLMSVDSFLSGLTVVLIPCIASGIGLIFAGEAIMMFHELVMNSRKQRDLLRDIARSLRQG